MTEESPARKPAAVEQRRELRQPLRVPVLVSGQLGAGARFDEKTTTLDVSNHGARVELRLQARLPVGIRVTLENLTSGEQLAFHVARVGELERGSYEVGLEASAPAARFWGLG